jgi:sec-independent protein translocase protein TatC
MPVGHEIAAGDPDDPDRYRPLTEAEMEAELDAIEAEELPARPIPNSPLTAAAEAWLQQANQRRIEGNPGAARHLLYQVLEQGNADQRQVARNILNDLDH